MSEQDNHAAAAAPKDETVPQELLEIKIKDQYDLELFVKVKKTTKMSKVKNAFGAKSGRNLATMRFTFDGEKIMDDDTPEALKMEDGDMIEVFEEQIGGTDVFANDWDIWEDISVEEQENTAAGTTSSAAPQPSVQINLNFTFSINLPFVNGKDSTSTTTAPQKAAVGQGSAHTNRAANTPAHGQAKTSFESPPTKSIEDFFVVIAKDNGDRQVALRVNQRTKMVKVKKLLCRRWGTAIEHTVLTFRGNIFQNRDTPEDFGMEAGDVINLHDQQFGGPAGCYANDWDIWEDADLTDSDTDTAPRVDLPEFIDITVKHRAKKGKFHIKQRCKMVSVKKAFCKTFSLDINSVRFHVDGFIIQDDDTPETLGMESGDVIEVYHIRTGGGKDFSGIEQDGTSADATTENTTKMEVRALSASPITDIPFEIWVMDGSSEIAEMPFQVKQSTPMLVVKQEFCEKSGWDFETTRFEFKGNRVKDRDTPYTLEMKPEDYIEVYKSYDCTQCSVQQRLWVDRLGDYGISEQEDASAVGSPVKIVFIFLDVEVQGIMHPFNAVVEISKKTKMGEVIKAICKSTGRDMESTIFRYDFEDRNTVLPDDTPENQGLRDGLAITVDKNPQCILTARKRVDELTRPPAKCCSAETHTTW